MTAIELSWYTVSIACSWGNWFREITIYTVSKTGNNHYRLLLSNSWWPKQIRKLFPRILLLFYLYCLFSPCVIYPNIFRFIWDKSLNFLYLIIIELPTLSRIFRWTLQVNLFCMDNRVVRLVIDQLFVYDFWVIKKFCFTRLICVVAHSQWWSPFTFCCRNWTSLRKELLSVNTIQLIGIVCFYSIFVSMGPIVYDSFKIELIKCFLRSIIALSH